MQAQNFEATFFSDVVGAKGSKDERLSYRVCNLSGPELYFVWKGAGFWSGALNTPKAGGCFFYSRPPVGVVGKPDLREVLVTRELTSKKISTIIDEGSWMRQAFDWVTSAGYSLPEGTPSEPQRRVVINSYRKQVEETVQFRVDFPSSMITCIGLPEGALRRNEEETLKGLKSQGVSEARILSGPDEIAKACLGSVRGPKSGDLIKTQFNSMRVLVLETKKVTNEGLSVKFSLPSKTEKIKDMPVMVFSPTDKVVWYVFTFPTVASGE
ncbi:hypothetical protein [Variovorax gossypii]